MSTEQNYCQFKKLTPQSNWNHTHSNEITICEKCNRQEECKVKCETPINNKLNRICLPCETIKHEEIARHNNLLFATWNI